MARRYERFWQRLPAVALSAAAVLLVIGLAIVLLNERSYRQARLGELAVQAKILAATATAAIAFKDVDAAREYVDALKADPAVRAVAIYTPDGALFAGFARPGALPLPARLEPGKPPNEEGRLTVTVPVTQNGLVLGTVYARALTDTLIVRAQRYSAIVSLVVLASLLVAVLGVAQSTLTNANAALADQAARLAEANAALQHQIAERERIEEALRQAQKMEVVGQLTGGIAHDFNNLLQVILGNLDLAQPRVAPGDKWLGRRLKAAQSAGRRAATLTGQLLAFARRQPLNPRPVDVNRLVDGMLRLLRRTLGEAVTIKAVLTPGLWRVSVDVNQLENALLNLAINARDAMPGGGTLTLSTDNLTLEDIAEPPDDRLPSGQYVRLAVTDTGTGMAPEILAKAFEPFFTTKEVGRGTGLGLSQVYGFVTQSGGHVRITSEPGSGTAVTIYLPRFEGAELPVDGEDTPLDLSDGAETALILLVEDNEEVRSNAIEMLDELGYRVIAVADGPAALCALDADPEIALLFTDIGLPEGLNGRQLADEARRRRPDLPVLFTTGYARAAVGGQSPFGPGIDLIPKPYGYAALAEKIRRMLEPNWLEQP